MKMKALKAMLMFLLFVGICSSVTSCSKDNDEENPEIASMIIGKWRIVQVQQNDGTMIDVTSSIAEMLFKPTYATFNSDGTYYGSGYFGNGSGTYKVKGKRIHTYVDGSEYIRYLVEDYTSTSATLVMSMAGSSSTMRVIAARQ